MFHIYSHFVMFVLPSLHETLSIALLEASYFKLPLIASDVGGIPEIIKVGITDFSPAADPFAFVAGNKEYFLRMQACEKRWERSEENLEIKVSSDSITTQIREIYQKL